MITAHFYKISRAAADSRSKSNRIAMLTRQRRAQVLHSGGIKVIRARDCQSETFLLGVQKGDILFREREYPPFIAPLLAGENYFPF